MSDHDAYGKGSRHVKELEALLSLENRNQSLGLESVLRYYQIHI